MTATETATVVDQPAVDTVVPEYFDSKRRPSLFSHEPKSEALGASGCQNSFVNAQGLRIASYYWPASAEAKAVMLFVHGHGAYLMHELLYVPEAGSPPKYKGSWVEKLNQEGFSVCGIDQQGCGFSEGLECYVDRFDHYVDDVLQFARSLSHCSVSGFSGVPLFLAGCSLGDALQSMGSIKRPLAALLSRIWPTLPAASTTKNHLYPDLQSLWDADPLCWHGATRARVANEYLLATEAGLKAMPSYTFPFIVFHGADDTLTDPDGSRTLCERSQAKDKTFKLIKARWHVLLKEPGNREILEEVIAWLKARI